MFPAKVEARFGLVSSKLEIPNQSPFSRLDISQPWLTVHADQMRLVVDAPVVVGQKNT